MMKKCFHSLVLLFILIFFFVPAGFAASPYADGEYSISYTVLKADTDSASMANDYFLKPVKLIVQNGEMKIQMSVKNSSWIQSVQIGGVTPTVISEDPANDKRTMEFKVADLSQPLQSNMHIKIDDMNYDNHYTVRFAFDASNVTAATDSKTNETKEQTGAVNQTSHLSTDQNESKTVANPQTNDSTNVSMMAIILVMSAAFLFLKGRQTNI